MIYLQPSIMYIPAWIQTFVERAFVASRHFHQFTFYKNVFIKINMNTLGDSSLLYNINNRIIENKKTRTFHAVETSFFLIIQNRILFSKIFLGLNSFLRNRFTRAVPLQIQIKSSCYQIPKVIKRK